MLPAWPLLLFPICNLFYILLQPCYCMLPIPLSTDKTSAVYPFFLLCQKTKRFTSHWDGTQASNMAVLRSYLMTTKKHKTIKICQRKLPAKCKQTQAQTHQISFSHSKWKAYFKYSYNEVFICATKPSTEKLHRFSNILLKTNYFAWLNKDDKYKHKHRRETCKRDKQNFKDTRWNFKIPMKLPPTTTTKKNF